MFFAAAVSCEGCVLSGKINKKKTLTRAVLCFTLLSLISQAKTINCLFLYQLDNYRCSKITAQQTVKLYLW